MKYRTNTKWKKGGGVTMLKAGIGIGIGSASYLFGGFDILLQTLLAFIVIDMATGMGAAWYMGNFKSREMYRGIFRKVMTLLILVTMVFFDRLILSGELSEFDALQSVLGVVNLRTATAGYLILREAVSLAENFEKAGVKVPKFIRKGLGKVVELVDQEDEKPKGEGGT